MLIKTKYEELENNYDMISNDLVFCCVKDESVDDILFKISDKINIGSHTIVNICNPFLIMFKQLN